LDLLLYAAAFMLWQCTASLPRTGVAVCSYFGLYVFRRGPTYALFSPWPGDLGICLDQAALPGAFSVASFREALDRSRRRLLPLRLACEVYLLFAFVTVPVLVAWLSGEVAWRLVLPVIGAIHASTLATLFLVERRLDPRPDGRLERWVGGALFPPALLRAPADLLAQRLAGFHGATAAAALLDEVAFVRVLRREVGRLGPDGGLRESLLSLCDQLGIDRKRVTAPPRIAPGARSYCPVCLDEFLVEKGRCYGCGADAIAYEESR
jgi:hypothetical protein